MSNILADVEELICELHHIAGSERIDVDVRKAAAKAESTLASLRAWGRGRYWIPVDERLPDDEVRVLATDGRDVFESEYMRGNWEWCADVTHWMKLPEPPEVAQ